MKRVVSLLCVLALCLSLLTVTALADDNVPYRDATGTMQTCPTATAVTSSLTVWGSEDAPTWYVVNGKVTINSRITVTGDVHLILADGCDFEAKYYGIDVSSGNSLTIYGQEQGTGKLRTQGSGSGAAGIGGNNTTAAHGNITINGGIIEARGGSDSAGIGGGYNFGQGKINGKIIINDGTVFAQGSNNAAGIGGGYCNQASSGNIVINGGTVTANGGSGAAGIGAGNSNKVNHGRAIIIGGDADVTANGGSGAAGIGGGRGYGTSKSIKSITIQGRATVKANGGEEGAGIGSAYATPFDASILIRGNAKVTANGGSAEDSGSIYGGAGIGSGGYGSISGEITIEGGQVTATGGTGKKKAKDSGAGIGTGGYGKESGGIFITGGTVTAKGGSATAAGIGSGSTGKDVTFATSKDDVTGNAVIYASSISDNKDTSAWSGIIFQGKEGFVYGDVSLDKAAMVRRGYTLTVPQSSKLTIPEGKKLTVRENAKLIVAQGAELINNGILANEGTLTVEGTLTGNAPTDSVASYTSATGAITYYQTLDAALTAANTAQGGTVELVTADPQDLTTAVGENVTLSVPNGTTLTVDLTGAGAPAPLQSKGRLVVAAGGALSDGAGAMIGGKDALIQLTAGQVVIDNLNVTAQGGSLDLTFEKAQANVTGYWTLALSSLHTHVTVDADSTLTVTDQELRVANDCTLTNDGQILVDSLMSVSSSGQVNGAGVITVNSNGVLEVNKSTTSVGTLANEVSNSGVVVWNGDNSDSLTGTITLASGSKVYSQANLFKKLVNAGALANKTYENETFTYAWGYYVPTPDTAPNTYAVVIDDTTHGTVNVAPNRAAEGKTVTLEVIPDQGYVLKSLTVTDADGKSLKLTQVSDSRYTFEMPGSAVTVEAVFAPKGLPFTDVSGHWALDAITYVYEHGMMNGISTTKFGPDVDLTRGMLVTILYRLENEPAAGSCPFSDVAKNAYYADPIAWAAAHEIVTGYSETSFGPNDPLTREQLATMLYRYAQYKGYDVSVGEDTNILSYKDFDEIHTYAIPAMQWACGAGILQGSSGALHPTATATRAQVATILMRYCEQ